MLGRRVLRARTMPGIAQEIYALLTAYPVIRIAIADATATVPGADPDRASFSIAIQAARDQVIQAAGVIAGTVIDLVGTIGRAVLNHPMPRPAVALPGGRARKRAVAAARASPEGLLAGPAAWPLAPALALVPVEVHRS